MSNENVQTAANANVEELRQKLCGYLGEYNKVELEWLKLEKYKTGKLWDIGDVAISLKEELGHGNWEPFVKLLVKEGWINSDRTLQRGMKIRKNFEHREACACLPVADAENVADKAEKITEEGATACKRVTSSRKKKLDEEVRKLREENERLEDELQRQAESEDEGDGDEPKDEEEEGDSERSYPGYEEADRGPDPDVLATNELMEALAEIVTEPYELSPEQEVAFGKFVEALGGDLDQALLVALTKVKLNMRKMYL